MKTFKEWWNSISIEKSKKLLPRALNDDGSTKISPQTTNVEIPKKTIEEQIADQKFLAKGLGIIGAFGCLVIMPISITLIGVGGISLYYNKDDLVFPLISSGVGLLGSMVGGIFGYMSFSACADKPEDYILQTVELTGKDNEVDAELITFT